MASHPRSYVKYDYSTLPEHRPASHRAHLEWTPSRLIDWGKSIGAHTGVLIEHVIRSKPHPEQGYRSALGILRLANKHGAHRLELACAKAFAIGSPSYKTVKTMLDRLAEKGAVDKDDASARAGVYRPLVARQQARRSRIPGVGDQQRAGAVVQGAQAFGLGSRRRVGHGRLRGWAAPSIPATAAACVNCSASGRAAAAGTRPVLARCGA